MPDKPIPVEIAEVTANRPVQTREVDPPPPVAVVPYWTYLVPVFTALITMIQVVALAYIGLKALPDAKAEISQGQAILHNEVQGTKEALREVHEQINSNLEKQFVDFKESILAKERLKRSEDKKGKK